MFKEDFLQLNSDAKMTLAFDFGFKKIGVAKGLTNFKIANPLTIIASQNNKVNWQAIENLVQTWQPHLFVVGAPFYQNTLQHNIGQAARGFAQKLHGRFSKTCFLVDESYSSLEAQSNLELTKVKQKHNRQIDADAACIILESFFSSHTNILNKLDSKGWKIKYE